MSFLNSSDPHYDIGLQNVLIKEEIVKIFKEFLRLSLCSENLEFFEEVDDYRKNFKEEEENLNQENSCRSMARSIYDKYISDSTSIYEINLSGGVLQQIKQDIENPTIEIFDKAQKEVYKLMEEDIYPRFRRYPPFREHMDAVNSSDSKRIPKKNRSFLDILVPKRTGSLDPNYKLRDISQSIQMEKEANEGHSPRKLLYSQSNLSVREAFKTRSLSRSKTRSKNIEPVKETVPEKKEEEEEELLDFYQFLKVASDAKKASSEPSTPSNGKSIIGSILMKSKKS